MQGRSALLKVLDSGTQFAFCLGGLSCERIDGCSDASRSSAHDSQAELVKDLLITVAK